MDRRIAICTLDGTGTEVVIICKLIRNHNMGSDTVDVSGRIEKIQKFWDMNGDCVSGKMVLSKF